MVPKYKTLKIEGSPFPLLMFSNNLTWPIYAPAKLSWKDYKIGDILIIT